MKANYKVKKDTEQRYSKWIDSKKRRWFLCL